MKKNFKLKKLMVLLIVIGIIFNSTIFVSANVIPARNYEEYKNYIMKFLKKDGFSGALQDNPIELYNLDEQVNYLCFNIQGKGYVIINTWNKNIPEYSLESNNKFVNKSEKVYYVGGLNYLVKQNDKFVDLKSKKDIKDIKKLKSNFKIREQQAKASGYTVNPTPYEEYGTSYCYTNSLSHTLPNYSYNPDGRCGATASAMFLQYFNKYLDSRYLPNNLDYAYEKELTDALVNYIPCSANVDELRSGLDSFLRSNGVYDGIRYSGIQMSRVMERIDNGRPFILGLFSASGNPYGNHWVTASGYAFTQLTPSGATEPQYIIINDGWGGTGIKIDIIYADYILW